MKRASKALNWIKAKWLGMKQDEQDITALIIFAILVIVIQALHSPEWVEYVLLAVGGLYIVFTSPKVKDTERGQK